MAIAVFIVLGLTLMALFMVYRIEQNDLLEMEDIVANVSEELLHLKEKLEEYEKAYGTAEEFNKTINSELERQARMEREWTEGVNNILAYNVKTTTGANKNE